MVFLTKVAVCIKLQAIQKLLNVPTKLNVKTATTQEIVGKLSVTINIM